jgi:hypothetical protein
MAEPGQAAAPERRAGRRDDRAHRGAGRHDLCPWPRRIARGAVGTAAIASNSVARADLQAAVRVPSAVVRTSAVARTVNGALGQASASCNAGETLIAGGGGIVSAPVAGAALLASRSEASPGTATPARWLVIMSNNGGGTIELQAFAICATAT